MSPKQKSPEFPFAEMDLAEGSELPRLLREYQAEARKVYRGLAFPTLKDEAWRRTSLRDLDVKSLELSNGSAAPDQQAPVPEDLLTSVPDQERRGRGVIRPGRIEVELDQELQDQGVIFSDLANAAEQHPDLVKKILGSVVDPSEGKFAALTAGYSGQGLFVYVPRGVRVEGTLHSLTWAAANGKADFSQLLIYLEEGASLTYLHETSSPSESVKQSLTGENVEIVVGNNAHLKIIELQTLDSQNWSMAYKKAQLHRDARLDWVMSTLGSKLTKHFISMDLQDQGAEGRVSALFFAEDQQHLSFNTRQNHNAPRTNSDLLFKGGLTGDSRSVWRGMIYVAPGAQYIDGYQANRNLILSDQARSDSIPGLEILNNDVRCTHGSTIGKIDQEQLFYLQARGIPKPQAEQLILQGFFEVIFGQIPFERVRDRIWGQISDKLTAASGVSGQADR